MTGCARDDDLATVSCARCCILASPWLVIVVADASCTADTGEKPTPSSFTRSLNLGAVEVEIDVNAGGLRVLGDVGERFADDGEEVLSDLGPKLVDLSAEVDVGFEPEGGGLFPGQFEDLTPDTLSPVGLRPQAVDRGPDLFDGAVDVSDRVLQPTLEIVVSGAICHGSHGHARSEEPTDHMVMHVPADSLSVLQQFESAVRFAAGGELDRHHRFVGERVDRCKVVFVEWVGRFVPGHQKHADRSRAISDRCHDDGADAMAIDHPLVLGGVTWVAWSEELDPSGPENFANDAL